jgi:hypothetical protein
MIHGLVEQHIVVGHVQVTIVIEPGRIQSARWRDHRSIKNHGFSLTNVCQRPLIFTLSAAHTGQERVSLHITSSRRSSKHLADKA